MSFAMLGALCPSLGMIGERSTHGSSSSLCLPVSRRAPQCRAPTTMLRTLAGCCFFPALYIIPFYLWPSGLPRNHPRTITRRMASSSAVCLAAWVPTWLSLAPVQVSAQLSGPREVCAERAMPSGPFLATEPPWRLSQPKSPANPARPPARRPATASQRCWASAPQVCPPPSCCPCASRRCCSPGRCTCWRSTGGRACRHSAAPRGDPRPCATTWWPL